MKTNRTVFLVPWRTDDGPRADAWRVCRRRWEALFPDWPIYEGVSPPGPFQRSAAINDAAARAGAWDIALIIDADVMLPASNVGAAVLRADASGKVVWAHRRWREMTEHATKKLVNPNLEAADLYAEGALGPGGIEAPTFSADLDLIVSSTTALSMSCCMAVTRKAWDLIGGFDERFVGWGHEDSAFAAATAHYAGWDRIEGDVLNLWHPRVPGAGRADVLRHKVYTPEALDNARLGIRYTVALRRDLGWTDRPERADRAVVERDIANLRRQDEKEMAAQQTPAARRRWDDYWPTIPELVEEARQFRVGTVAVVVHTGGQPANWPTRRGYLEASLASLVEKVSGPIVQRVVYDCWGDPAIRREIEPLANRYGFYVVGPIGGMDFTVSMQTMWSYIRRRVTADFVFAVEDDFTYDRPVDLADLVAALRSDPGLVQVALLRDACYGDERELAAIGNILGWPRPAFTFRPGWFEHRQFWTNNPSLFRRSLTERPWPSGHHSETIFGRSLFADKALRSAFWGTGEPWITHIGAGAGGRRVLGLKYSYARGLTTYPTARIFTA